MQRSGVAQMSYRRDAALIFLAVAAFAAVACSDSPAPSEPNAAAPSHSRSATAQDRLAALFPGASAEVLAIPGTVYADHDEARGKLVFGVHSANAITGIQKSLAARGLSAEEYEIVAAEPIHQLAHLQTSVFRPTIGGIQIHFGGYLCTLGFNVDAGGVRSFITNSHCTNDQGGVEGTVYNQPTRTAAPTAIATEVADPTYGSLPGCSPGKVCRYSDASRAAYASDAESSRGIIAKTTGVNTGSLTTAATNFVITSQDNSSTSFSGNIDKVGRTTGWTRGTVTGTCVNVNVSGSNIQQMCQTLVTNSGVVIVSGGDSGSPVFKYSGTDNVQLIGILWGGGGTSQFVFSPLKNIQDELGGVTATADGSGGGGGGGGGEEPPPCIPKGPKGNNCK